MVHFCSALNYIIVPLLQLYLVIILLVCMTWVMRREEESGKCQELLQCQFLGSGSLSHHRRARVSIIFMFSMSKPPNNLQSQANTVYLLQWREDRFRETSESTNQRVLWWAIAQTLLLVTVGFWQMRHLRGFFEAKKLV